MKMLEIPVPKTGSFFTTKEAVLQILSEKQNLTAKELYAEVVKETKKNVSYQALHKTLQQLEKEMVVQRIQNKYSLHPNWLQALGRWLEKTKNQAATESKQSKKPEIRVFNSIIDTGRFLIFDYFHYPNPKNKISVCIWKRMYSLIGLSKDEVEGVRETMGKEHFRVVSESNTIVDQFIAEAFEQMGGKVKLGVPNPEDFDSIVVGDYICEIYFSAIHKKNWKAHWERPKKMDEFDLEGTLKIMHTAYDTKIIVYHDPVRAQQIREKVLKEFSP